MLQVRLVREGGRQNKQEEASEVVSQVKSSLGLLYRC